MFIADKMNIFHKNKEHPTNLTRELKEKGYMWRNKTIYTKTEYISLGKEDVNIKFEGINIYKDIEIPRTNIIGK